MSSKTESAISVVQLQKSYGSNQVLHDVSFDVPSGQTLALLGRNGVGKTTLIRMMLGLLPHDAGEIRILGINPQTHPLDLRRNVGYLAEDQTMYGWMTAIELSRFLAPFYPTWDAGLVDRYLKRFEVPQQTPIENLSKGQSVKLGLAVALAHNPRVVILDDPALGLDPVSRKEFNRDLVEHLQSDGRTVIYSSHLLDEVDAVADLVAILDRGRIVRFGPCDQLREDVQRLILPRSLIEKCAPPAGLLDAVCRGDQVEVVVDGATEFVGRLSDSGQPVQVSSMTLDDIFAAYVTGRPQAWNAVSKT